MTKECKYKAALEALNYTGYERDRHIATIREALEQMADEGTVRVPREPKDIMLIRGAIAAEWEKTKPSKMRAMDCYRAMIAAQESSSEGGGE